MMDWRMYWWFWTCSPNLPSIPNNRPVRWPGCWQKSGSIPMVYSNAFTAIKERVLKGTSWNDDAICMKLKRAEPHHITQRAMANVKDSIECCMICCTHSPKRKKRKWPQHLPQELYAYNTTEHQSTGYSQYELKFGQKAQLPVDFLLGESQEELMSRSARDWVDEHQKHLNSSSI